MNISRILILVCFLITQLTQVQCGFNIYSGKVVAAEDGRALQGAWIEMKGTSNICISDASGHFYLKAVPDSVQILLVSYLGMKTRECPLQDNFMLIELETLATALQEVVTVAYGQRTEKTLIGSVYQIQGQDLAQRQLTNAIKALDGLVPGLQVSSGGGQPGSGAFMIIRGIGSLTASSAPLIVLDGQPYVGDLSSLDLSEIASLSILKDAAAAALYGSRGANGVLLLETKKGQAGPPECTLKLTYGRINRAIAPYQSMGVKSYMECIFRAYKNKMLAQGMNSEQATTAALQELSLGPEQPFGLHERYNPYDLPLAELYDPLSGTIRQDARLLWEEDWIRAVEAQAPDLKKYYFGLGGGTSILRYRMSASWLDEKGLLATTAFQRLSGSNSLEVYPAAWISVRMMARFSHNKYKTLGAKATALSNVWYSALMMGPVFPVYQRDLQSGAWLLDDQGNRLYDYGEQRAAGQQQHFNSVAVLYKDEYSGIQNDLAVRAQLNLGSKAPGALHCSIHFAADHAQQEERTYYNPSAGNAVLTRGRLSVEHQDKLSYTLNQELSQHLILAEHRLDWFLAHEYFFSQNSGLYGIKTGFESEKLRELDAAALVYGTGGSAESHRLESYFGRLNYQYADNCFVSASLRRDASSRFQRSKRWGDFWSIGLNYRLSQVECLKKWEHLDHLALRFSYGVQGNEALLQADGLPNYYAWQNLLDYSYANAAQAGAMLTMLADKDVGWESSKNFNFGWDLFCFERFQFNLDAYVRFTEKMLLWYPMAPSTGFTGYNKNTGSMMNSGLEVFFKAQILPQGPVRWQAGLSASLNRNRVLALSDQNRDIVLGHQIIRVGEPLYSYFVCSSAGVDQADGEQLYWAVYDSAARTTEPYMTKDLTAALLSRKIAGSRSPNVYGSLQQNLRFHILEISLQINYSIGGKILDKIYMEMLSFRNPAQAKHSDLEKAWKQSGDLAVLPRYELGKSYQMTDAFLIDASYLSLKHLCLSYHLNLKNLSQLKACTLSLAAENLFHCSNLRGMDPQYDFVGSTEYAYVPVRTISLQLCCKF